MKKRLKSISILQAGIVLGTFQALIALVMFTPFLFLFALVGVSMPSIPPTLTNGAGQPLSIHMPAGVFTMGMALVFAFVIPFIYAVIGFIFGIIAAIVYNIIAAITGGIEVTVTDA